MQSARRRVTPQAIRDMKSAGHPITLLSAYDYPMARCADLARIDIAFVSDAFAMVGLGRENTFSVTVEEVIYHTKAVRSGSGACLVLSSLPFLSYGTPSDALLNAGRLIKEGGAHAVEIEGGVEVAPIVEFLAKNGIAVVSHIGLTKQLSFRTGTHRIQGKAPGQAMEIVKDALSLDAAGAFALILECVPDRLAEIITTAVDIPTIGIGAGPYCDGQGLVSEDMLGLYDKFCPKFVRQYRNLSKEITDAFCSFRDDVGSKHFPGPEHTTRADEKWIKEFQSQLGIDEGSDRNDIRKKIFASGSSKPGGKTEKQVARRPSRS